MSWKNFPGCWCTILLLVALRIAIGWHFFNEGRDHYFDEKWSSKSFLNVAIGPFAAQAKKNLNEQHDFENLLNKPFNQVTYDDAHAFRHRAVETINKDQALARKNWNDKLKALKEQIDSKEITISDDRHPLYINPIYGAWAKQVRDDWNKQIRATIDQYGWQHPEKDLDENKPAKPADKADAEKKAAVDDLSMTQFVVLQDAKEEKSKEEKPATKEETPATESKDKPADKSKDEPKVAEPAKADDKKAAEPAAKAEAKAAAPAKPAAISAKDAPAYLYKMRDVYLGELEKMLAGMEYDLFEYRADLMRLETKRAAPYAQEIPFETKRIDDMKKELTGKPNGWKKTLAGLDAGMVAILEKAAGPENLRKAPIPTFEPTYKKLDRVVVWVLMIGGACMVLGLFTRTASFVLGLFLLSVVILQPFWLPDAVKTTYFEWGEMLTCFALATTGVGRYFGLDYFIHALVGSKEDNKAKA